MGSKRLQGIFAGYHLHSGGRWSGDLLLYDWDQIADAEYSHEIHIRRQNADEISPVLVDEEFLFPLAEGDLHQPDIKASQTRRSKAKKRKQQEKNEDEQAAQEKLEKEALEEDDRRK